MINSAFITLFARGFLSLNAVTAALFGVAEVLIEFVRLSVSRLKTEGFLNPPVFRLKTDGFANPPVSFFAID